MMRKRFGWALPLLVCLFLAGCDDGSAGMASVTIAESSIEASAPSLGDAVSLDASSQTEPDVADGAQVDQEEPEMHGLEYFLKTALLPVGETAYIWGGGWNEEDNGAGVETRTIGLCPGWKEFAKELPSNYNYKKTRYQIHDGLDCSGFVGWVVYNTLETEDGKEGYVYTSTEVAQNLAALGLGEFTAAKSVTEWKPGDVASMNGHVWISLGTCEDGSVLLVHSSPPGVRLCGIAKSAKAKDAVKLAENYMRTYYPDWYSRFPDCESPKSYLKKTAQFRWSEETFPDAAQIQSMTPEALLKLLYNE